MSIITDPKKVDELLSRGVEEVIDQEHLRARLLSGEPLRVKFGVDPTSPNLHLGRSVPLLKLRDFQALGHQIVLIIGDFTGVIGDTSDKESERPMLSEEQVKTNMASYTEQAGRVIDLSRCEIHHNSEWLGKLTYGEIGRQADAFSLSDFVSRENIKKRLDGGKRVSLREVLYPLMQGYDSVAIKADVEVGGTDQRFNLLAGRELLRSYGQPAQDIMTNPLIEGLDGRKMSSSWGNTINLTDAPREMYGKVMSLRDELVIKYFTLVTRADLTEIKEHEAALKAGQNPKEIKMKLARELTRFYHSAEAAQDAESYFESTFSKKETPTDMPELKPESYDLVSVLLAAGFAESKSDARRAIEQNGVKVNNETATDPALVLKPGDVVQKGKRFFARVG